MKGRQIQLNYEWKWIELDEKEIDEVMNKLLENNIKELKRIIRRLSKEKINELEFKDAVSLLFDKQATASFTVINNALEKKLFRLRNETYQKRKSLIEKAFEREG